MGVGGQCAGEAVGVRLAWMPLYFMAAIFLTTSVLCLLQDTPQEDSEVGIGMEISLFQALFILFPDFSSRCSGALASREMGKKLMFVCSWKGIRLRDIADIFLKKQTQAAFP